MKLVLALSLVAPCLILSLAAPAAFAEDPPAFLLEWGTKGSGDGEFELIRDVAVGPQGNVYVSDGVTNRIQKFDGNGNFLIGWGSTGEGNGQFTDPLGLAVLGVRA